MSNNRLIDVISKLISKEIVFETNSGSIGLATDDDGRLRIGGIDAPGTSNTLVIDPINNKIQTANITFSDGTYLDSAAGLGISNPTITLFQIKTNKVFFKYNQDDTPLPNQLMLIKLVILLVQFLFLFLQIPIMIYN